MGNNSRGRLGLGGNKTYIEQGIKKASEPHSSGGGITHSVEERRDCGRAGGLSTHVDRKIVD